MEGETQIHEVVFYNLDTIISVGYHVNSIRDTQFRQWCTCVLWQFAIRGYVIDRKRMANGSFVRLRFCGYRITTTFFAAWLPTFII
jgi:hypothetical protein